MLPLFLLYEERVIEYHYVVEIVSQEAKHLWNAKIWPFVLKKIWIVSSQLL